MFSSPPSCSLTFLYKSIPSTYSITIKWILAAEPMSKARAMLGWLSLAEAIASRSNRFRYDVSVTRFTGNTLIATFC